MLLVGQAGWRAYGLERKQQPGQAALDCMHSLQDSLTPGFSLLSCS